MSISGLKNKKVLIFGLGLNEGGVGMARYFTEKGAIVSVTDMKTEEDLKSSIDKLKEYNISYHLGTHVNSDFETNDIIVRNPAVKPNNPFLQIAHKNKKKIIVELLYVLKHIKGEIIGVTGTKGKSTTTTLIYEILKKHNANTFLGGNLRTSTIELLDKANKKSTSVLELPSFQLEDIYTIKKSPNIAVITNIKNDHVNWHGSLERYQQAKMNIFKYQKKTDFCVINIDDEMSFKCMDEIPSKVVKISLKKKDADYYIDEEKTVFEKSKRLFQLDSLNILGKHNLYNVLQAIAVARIKKVPTEVIKDVLENYESLEGRQQFIAEINGVKIYNDTTATNIEALETCLNTFRREYKNKIVLICGGMDKELDFSRIPQVLNEDIKYIILLEGSASERIYDQLKNLEISIHKYFNSMSVAVKHAMGISEKGDVLILCPGAASFNLFVNEFDRGEKFVEAVKKFEKI